MKFGGRGKRDPKKQVDLDKITKPYDRRKEGRGRCSECQIENGHRAGCWKAGT